MTGDLTGPSSHTRAPCHPFNCPMNERPTRLCSCRRHLANLAVSLRLHQQPVRMCTVPNPDMQPAREVQVPPSHWTWDTCERIHPRGSETERFLSCWSRPSELVMLGVQDQEEQHTKRRQHKMGVGKQPKSNGVCRPHVHAVVWPKHQVTDLRRRDAEQLPSMFTNRHPVDHVQGRPVVTSGWQRATGTLRGPRAYRRSFLPLKGLSSSPHFVHLALMAWKSQGRSWRKSRKIVWKASLKFSSDRADPDRLFHALEGSHPLPGPGPGQHNKQTSRSILRQSVLDRVCCARQIRDPSHQSSLNPSSYRRLFPSKIRPLPREPTIWNISSSILTLQRRIGVSSRRFVLARTTNSRPGLFTINSSKPRQIPNDAPSPSFSSPIFSLSSHIHLFTHNQGHHRTRLPAVHNQPRNMACGSACCGPPRPPSQPAAEPTSQSTSGDGPGDVAKGGTANNKDDDHHDDNHKDNHDERSNSDINVQYCCNDPADGGQGSSGAGAAKDHMANIDGDAKNNGADACCSSQDQSNDDPVTPPDCCDGTTVPCCGDACIDRLALRACNGEKQPTAPLPSYEGVFASRCRSPRHQAHDTD